MKIRDLLDNASPRSLKSLLGARKLPRSGLVEDLRQRLARSYHGDVEQLIGDAGPAELVDMLDDEVERDGLMIRLTGLATAERTALAAAVRALVADAAWRPLDGAEVPGSGGQLSVEVLEDLNDGDDDLLLAADDGDQPEPGSPPETVEGGDDDLDSPAFSSPEYRAAFAAEVQTLPAERRASLRPFQVDAFEALKRALFDGQVAPRLLHVATGGGKTMIANHVLKEFLGMRGGPVLWVTKDWRLLKQAAVSLCQHETHMLARLGRVGGAARELSPLPDDRLDGVVYTTLHTFLRRAPYLARRLRPTLVVWDECHWGEDAQTGRRLLRFCADRGIPLLGLTATPRPPTQSEFQVVYSKSFSELVEEGVLARPVPRTPVETHVRWRPQRLGPRGDFRPDSLAELARSQRRNELIVKDYVANAATYGKTIVFACDIEHADRLAELFCHWSGGGVPARAVHSELSSADVERAITDFRSGAIRVLVNVAMLTTGFDAPDAQTVLLCRPTASDVLFSQMIGRGSRRTDTKTTFNIVEFTDNLEKYRDILMTATRFFAGTTGNGAAVTGPGPSGDRRGARPPRPPGFDPAGAPTWIPDDPAVADALRGLWYRQGQTFGVEIELTRPGWRGGEVDGAWQATADALRASLAAALPELVAPRAVANPGDLGDYGRWNVTYDRSAGWEVTSRILRDRAGFEELVSACDALDAAARDLGLRVNHRTGLHVHLGWRGADLEELKRAIHLVRLFEPALASLVAPSRLRACTADGYDLRAPNEYCQPVATVLTSRRLAGVRSFDDLWRLTASDDARRLTFNVKPLEDLQTVEVRLHSGTTEARKIAPWISLWMQLLWAASQARAIPDVPDAKLLEPSADLLALAREWLPAVQSPRLLERLAARRREIVDRWADEPQFERWCTYAAGWA